MSKKPNTKNNVDRYDDGQLDYTGINKKLLNIAEGKYPISPHEREKYMSVNTLKVK